MHRLRNWRPAPVFGLAIVAWGLAAAAPAADVGEGPAATLLVPYFEVELADPAVMRAGGRFSVGLSATPVD